MKTSVNAVWWNGSVDILSLILEMTFDRNGVIPRTYIPISKGSTCVVPSCDLICFLLHQIVLMVKDNNWKQILQLLDKWLWYYERKHFYWGCQKCLFHQPEILMWTRCTQIDLPCCVLLPQHLHLSLQ